MGSLLMERLHFAKGLDPVADAFAGASVASDVINCKNLERVLFVVYVGVGATGTSTVTVEACDDVTPTNTSAIAYRSRLISSGDTEGTITDRASTGHIPTAGSSKIVLIEVDVSQLAASGYGYVRLKAVESVDSPVLGSILVIGESNLPSSLKPTAIV
jgi:hypothetical protein